MSRLARNLIAYRVLLAVRSPLFPDDSEETCRTIAAKLIDTRRGLK